MTHARKAALLLSLALGACTTVPKEKGDLVGRGTASWYGKQFQGRKTASGEPFDMHKLTAAHRTLAFDTMVRVRSLSTKKEVLVRINDRGPYAGDRIIDLSHEAARRLGFIDKGHDEVEIYHEGRPTGLARRL